MALTAPVPEGPWSEPVPLGLEAIDPGHVADQEGDRYLHTGRGYMTKLPMTVLRAGAPHGVLLGRFSVMSTGDYQALSTPLPTAI
ncbi:hypothetical protein LJK87_01580 [Paenibacillus sp. P25]|nr:hypothetical protein LJK87_01580 [Paenibacillus sp. P25]